MINFKYVDITGFGSILNLRYNFDPGLTIIKAENGVGKTTIFNAWYWCLTGETLKPKCSINTWDHIRPLDYLGTRVIVSFNINDISYEIIRCHEFMGQVEGGRGNNRLIIKENGEKLNIKSKADSQKYLLEVLGYSPELLKNTLVFGQKLKRLIDESGTNKKEILEEAFDLVFIKEAQEKAKKRKQSKLSEYGPVRMKYETLITELAGKKELLGMAIENETDNEERLNQQIKDKEKEIKELKQELDFKQAINKEEDFKSLKRKIFELDKGIKKLEKQKESYYQVSGEIGTLTAKSSSIKRSINDLSHDLEELESSKKASKKKCNWCGQTLKGESKETSAQRFENEIAHYKDRINTGKKELELIKGQIEAKNRQLSSLEEVIDQYNTALANKKELEKDALVISQELNSLEQYTNNIKKAEEELLTLKQTEFKKKSTRIKLQIRKLRNQIKPIKKEVKARQRELDVLEWLVKDPLSNSGLKAFIFNDMIHLLNDKMAKYSHYFGFKVQFDINMDSARKDVDAFIFKGNDIISYQDLSGGQAQFVAVIMAFGLHDIVVKGNKSANLLLMDEIFEGLSKDNVEKVTEIIRTKMGNLSVNLITHRSEFNPYNSRVIRLKSKEGQTIMEKV